MTTKSKRILPSAEKCLKEEEKAWMKTEEPILYPKNDPVGKKNRRKNKRTNLQKQILEMLIKFAIIVLL
jgi:hypothetical protein